LKRGKETLVTFFALEKRNYKKKIYNSKWMMCYSKTPLQYVYLSFPFMKTFTTHNFRKMIGHIQNYVPVIEDDCHSVCDSPLCQSKKLERLWIQWKKGNHLALMACQLNSIDSFGSY
jgi:hypothetical protein